MTEYKGVILSDNYRLSLPAATPPHVWRLTTIHSGHCTYNVIFKRVRVTILTVEKKYVLHILSVCTGRGDGASY